MADPFAKHSFGSCCDSLNEAITSKEFEPLIEIGDDGILYMSLGLVGGDGDDDEPSMIDHPVFFCPFCGTKVQTAEEVDKKMAAAGKTSDD